jgi:tRNA U34 5-methylaminomethyl-2-thiouridine-forming methyltransferase MnmC
VSFRSVPIPPYLVNEHYDDRYFDVLNALDEADHVFFKGNRIIERLTAGNLERKTFSIGETGFGAGRLLIALMELLGKSGLMNVDIDYYSVELHPVTSERMSALLDGFRPRVGHLIDLLVNAYAQLTVTEPGWRQLRLARPFGSITLHLYIGEALEMVNALDQLCDAWFLDGHGPKKNPEMWRPELLAAIGKKTADNGTCATYTVARIVRQGLEDAGFKVERWPGFGGKNVVLRGMLTGVI